MRIVAGTLAAARLLAGTARAGEMDRPKLSKPDWTCAQAVSQYVQSGLTNNGLIGKNTVLNDKTDIDLLAKQTLGAGRSRLVFKLVLHETDGKSLTVITNSESGMGECPSDESRVYVVSKGL